MKTAVIFGVTGQDGSYLSELLLEKGYRVVGVSRRTSTPNNARVRHLSGNGSFVTVGGDVTDAMCVTRIISTHGPDEVYNLAAQSHVGTSFSEPAHTWVVTAQGALNVLDACRYVNDKIKVYQASSSEMFGSSFQFRGEPGMFEQVHPTKWTDHNMAYQDESTPFAPNSPYAIAKLAAHHAVRSYRESYGLFACSGILFNHESERRGEEFVTRKITKYVATHTLAKTAINPLVLGNMDACRDWGHASDYVYAMWLMLQQDKADDYVIATGETHSVREFLEQAYSVVGVPTSSVDAFVSTGDARLQRPNDVNYLRGDASKAKKVLGWAPKVSFSELVRRMVLSDVESIKSAK